MVLILGGTNDLWWDLDVNLIQANIFAMTCQAEFHNITPIVGLPLPLQMQSIQGQDMMAPIAGWPRCVQKLAELAAALESAARASDIALLDFYHLFQDQDGAPIAEYFLADGLHPSKQGHQRMSEKAIELLCSQFYFQNK
jgi:lysophospholipase L1-like esterase